MKTKMSPVELKNSFEKIIADNIKNLDKIENIKNMEYFADQEIEGYPWWEKWKEEKLTLEAESIEYGEKFHETRSDEDYDKYSESMAKLDELKRKINDDVEKYKEEYEKRIKETLKDTIDEVKSTVKYNVELIDKRITELTRKRDVLLRDKDELGKSYKGENYEEFFYSKINNLFKKINELENDKRSLLNVERDLDIEKISKRLDLENNRDNNKTNKTEEKNEKVNREKKDGNNGRGKEGKDNRENRDGNNERENEGKGNRGNRDINNGRGKEGKDNRENRDGNNEHENNEIIETEEKDISSNSYNKSLEEYKEMLSMYEDAFWVLGDLQKQYQNGEIAYSEYENQALYVSDRYKYMMEEYAKIKGQYDIEKSKEDKFANISNEDLENKLKELDEETTELWQQGVHENTPDEKRYHEALEEIKKIKEEIKQRQENPLRGMSLEELEAKRRELYAKIGEQQEPDEYHFRAHQENGLEGYDEDEIDKGLRQIREEIERRQPKLEAPEEPTRPGMILEEKKEDIPQKEENNLPARSFWEIYSETNSEHASNLAIKMHNFAHMKLLPRKEEDTATKALSYALLIFKTPLKLAAIIPNKLMKTDKKLQEMQENIDGLSPEEFQVLVSSADKVNEMFGDTVKDSFDTDYLDPQFMKQHKVNELYLKAVGSRLTRERLSGIDYCRMQIKECDNRLKELGKISKNRELTEEEVKEYNGLTYAKQELSQQGKDLRQEIDTFNDGVKKKSSAFKNIRGWFLGKFNPDNRKENAKMAQMSKERREAGQIGNISQVSRKTNEMQDYAKGQTVLRGFKRDKLDRGKYSIEDSIEMLDRGAENRGRLLLTNVALVTSVLDLVQQITNARNMQVTKEVQVSGEAKVSELDGAKEAQEGIARQTVEGTFNRNERANLDANDWNLGSSGYKAGDAITHTEGAQAAKAVQDAIARGDAEGALRIATDYFQKNASKDEAAMGAYAQANPFDYTAVNFGGAKDAQAIMDFFGGTVKFSDTVKVTIDGINNGINPLAAIFAGANAMHQAQKQGVKDGFKEQLKKDAKKKETKKEKTNKVETKGKATQENPSKEDERY